jgi:hypothetical protein
MKAWLVTTPSPLAVPLTAMDHVAPVDASIDLSVQE